MLAIRVRMRGFPDLVRRFEDSHRIQIPRLVAADSASPAPTKRIGLPLMGVPSNMADPMGVTLRASLRSGGKSCCPRIVAQSVSPRGWRPTGREAVGDSGIVEGAETLEPGIGPHDQPDTTFMVTDHLERTASIV